MADTQNSQSKMSQNGLRFEGELVQATTYFEFKGDLSLEQSTVNADLTVNRPANPFLEAEDTYKSAS